MSYGKIIRATVFFLMITTLSRAQSSYFATDFVPYRMIAPVDSVFTHLLDSLNEDALAGVVLELIPTFCNLSEQIYSLLLLYVPDMETDTINYLPYLARNTKNFYLSNNRKFKIPIIIAEPEDIFKYDSQKFPLLSTDSPRYFFSIIVVTIRNKIDIVKCEIPKWALKSEFRGE